MAKAGSTEQTVREIRRRTRRQFSAEEKIRIVLEGLRGEESIAALCRREGLAPNLYYRWSKDFLEAGKKRLLGDTTREATSTEVQDLRRENSQLKQVVAAAVLENRVLKEIWWAPVRGTLRATDRGREHEIIRLVEGSELLVRRRLRALGVHRSTFYAWYRPPSTRSPVAPNITAATLAEPSS